MLKFHTVKLGMLELLGSYDTCCYLFAKMFVFELLISGLHNILASPTQHAYYFSKKKKKHYQFQFT